MTAARHDHRSLGRELQLFGTDPLIGAGLPYWLPDGATVRHALEEYIRGVERRAGYRHVCSPALGKRELYELSGHWDHYADDMFPPLERRAGNGAGDADAADGADGAAGNGTGEVLVLRPSLCPHHAVIYRSRAHSYRELPLRMAELGTMYRAERSGVLGGLTRVRAIQLNDAHIFCTLDQVAAETRAALELIRDAYRALGIEAARYRLSLPAPGGDRLPGPDAWRQATALLTEALEDAGLPYEAAEGEAAFYGPKIDVQIADAAGREATLSTVQVDLHQPERFDLRYTGADGGAHRPVMVHRAVLGSVERAVAQLIEVHGGAFPAWLAPVQLAVLPVSEAERPAGEAFVRRCVAAGLRADLAPPEHGSLGARVREARRVPYQVVLGSREAAAGRIAVRLRDGRRLDPLPESDVVARIGALVERHSTALW
ncbi:threonine--tRNA ligase [Streptomyces qinglanensis]|uniref:Threonine--tRNA ligase n=1 Tax=Streptomyces qinglanensis TaxID=943816 RepID=A0A1H9NLC2_9ACTN|nr:threonine--tRNA ligase [Streptomyces qinglanensis]SER36557.1 threonyl-tRNA synthetase [Streptomyces qinglanensis]